MEVCINTEKKGMLHSSFFKTSILDAPGGLQDPPRFIFLCSSVVVTVGVVTVDVVTVVAVTVGVVTQLARFGVCNMDPLNSIDPMMLP